MAAAGLAAVALGWGGGASAQELDPFGSIVDRARPGNAAPPINWGGFEVTPRIGAEVEAIDNVFASEQLNVSDVTVAINPSVLIAQRRSDRFFSLDVSTGFVKFLDETVDDRFRAQIRGQARLGLGTRTRPFFGFEFRQNDARNAARVSLSNIEQPLKLTSYGGNLGVEQEFGPFTATAEGRFRRTTFDGVFVAGQTQVDAGFRDFDLLAGRARLSYSVNPAQRFYVEANFDRRDFSTSPLNAPALPVLQGNRSSESVAIRVGYARQLTELLLLDVNVGYLKQEFDDPRFSGPSAYSFDGRLSYSPSQLTRFQLRASRTVDDTVNPLFTGLLRTEFSFGVEHELRRDLVLSSEARYVKLDSGDNTADGSEYWLTGTARYYFTRNILLRLQAEYFRRDGVFAGDQTRGLIGVAYVF
ncbi:outer membrane beta-barrel protein [Blastomonas aquatica]|uniref:Outer membrane beta-barrel protein n=1 Tax=Blastomonas aquatica TaxID=1510276 RepID=A0ABQ1JSJ1_9SPHN|nr:outer membrane beta-barrel protein [Blastomonas aquatica]GGB75725.1 hypothetical protein GCM10010833_33730 [Blastomonas aquatica]